MTKTEEEEDGCADDNEDDDSEADDGSDMQLAWEMLEHAKHCYSSSLPKHQQQLAGDSQCSL